MKTPLVPWKIAGLISAAFVFVLSGCMGGVWHPTEARYLGAKVSIGDAREDVRAVLGEPLLDARSLSLEVYRQTGRDIDFGGVFPIFLPTPGKKVIGIALVAYDEHDMVRDLAADYWVRYQLQASPSEFWITAGGYHFVNNFLSEPETLLGPAIPAQQLVEVPVHVGKCALVLVMGECAVQRVLLDGNEVVDLTAVAGKCGGYWDNNLFGTFLRLHILPGRHKLDMQQDIPLQRSKLESNTVFDCRGGETVYAEFSVDEIEDVQGGTRLNGEILINKRAYKRLMDMSDLSPMLWHSGTWYGPTDQ